MMQPSNQYRVYAKAIRVIDSCTNPAHLTMARRYVQLANATLSRMATEFSHAAMSDLSARLSRKGCELKDEMHRAGWMHGVSSGLIGQIGHRLD